MAEVADIAKIPAGVLRLVAHFVAQDGAKSLVAFRSSGRHMRDAAETVALAHAMRAAPRAPLRRRLSSASPLRRLLLLLLPPVVVLEGHQAFGVCMRGKRLGARAWGPALGAARGAWWTQAATAAAQAALHACLA